MTTATEVKERPILFSGEMVRAILDGRKTETRRPVKWVPYTAGDVRNWAASSLTLGFYCTDLPTSGYVLSSRGAGGCWNDRTKPAHCPYGGIGDRLYVREKWRCHLGDIDDPLTLNYAADDTVRDVDRDSVQWEPNESLLDWKWHPSILMPRWAARINLKITWVRIERLKKITGTGVAAEGFPFSSDLDQFKLLWNKLNSSGLRWDDDPWVWVIEFKRVESS